MKLHKRMKRDCRRFMKGTALADFLWRLISVAAPTVTAWMIGDMADYLLVLDRTAIVGRLAPFLCAVVFQVAVSTLMWLKRNLLLTRKGFAYDGFLMEKFLRLPLPDIQATDAGAVMERLEEDSAAFFWNQMTLTSLPPAILLYAGTLAAVMIVNRFHPLFSLTVILLSALPVLRAARVGKRQAQLKKEASEHNERRRQLEQELFDARDLARSLLLESFFVQRLTRQFHAFLGKTGKAQNRMDAKDQILDFLCGFGAQIGAVLVGAILISLGKLTIGALLSGFLMLPAIQTCCQYIKTWVTELRQQSRHLTRLSFFYSPGEDADPAQGELTALSAENLTFSYPGAAAPVLSDFSFSVASNEACQLTGPNGCGKTTLLSLLAGLYEPQAGAVCGGAPLSQRRTAVALQEQDGAIFSGTVWSNLFLPEDRRPEAEALLDELGLGKALDFAVTAQGADLSPGEKKKLLLARALLRDTPFLLLDEPLNHLDDQGKAALVRRIALRQGGLLLISHREFLPPDFPIRLCPIQQK